MVASYQQLTSTTDLDLWAFNPKTISLEEYLKVIPYIKFEHFGIIRFSVMLRAIMWKCCIEPVTLTFDLSTQTITLLVYPKDIPYTKFEHFEIFRFYLNKQANKVNKHRGGSKGARGGQGPQWEFWPLVTMKFMIKHINRTCSLYLHNTLNFCYISISCSKSPKLTYNLMKTLQLLGSPDPRQTPLSPNTGSVAALV